MARCHDNRRRRRARRRKNDRIIRAGRAGSSPADLAALLPCADLLYRAMDRAVAVIACWGARVAAAAALLHEDNPAGYLPVPDEH